MWDEVKSFSKIEEDRNHRQLAIDRFADVEHYLDDRVHCALAMLLVGAPDAGGAVDDVAGDDLLECLAHVRAERDGPIVAPLGRVVDLGDRSDVREAPLRWDEAGS